MKQYLNLMENLRILMMNMMIYKKIKESIHIKIISITIIMNK